MKIESAPRIGGWLWLPFIWLVLTLLTSTLVMGHYVAWLLNNPIWHNLFSQSHTLLIQIAATLVTAAGMWIYSAWVTWLFYQRSSRLPRHYIIWLLLTIALSLKSWALSPVSEAIATRNLLISLLAAALFAVYLRRSKRAKTTFIEP
ncbi:Protein of unknown function [Izhakiella capsodis]|uniref:Inner membrane protein n=1 Tax=Izhakiella capsodis TaxID=1367852 RepID=A0A1I4VCP1_9GAMM|nr:DUF2569 domain-containing protein [Izhakiella capsodis]SFM98943.1 Protein of unknown function [Izhakiella capsodis]